MPTLTKEIISAAIVGFEEQRRKLDTQIAELRSMLSDSPDGSTASPKPTGRKKRKMSAAGRKAIAEAQRKRWAASKGTAAEPKAAKKPKRKLSAAGRAAIVAALKKRWAAKKAA
jgi:peptidoglycan hydrolase CwlO-like protein